MMEGSIKLFGQVPYFIEYSAHFIYIENDAKNSQRTIHRRKVRRGLRPAAVEEFTIATLPIISLLLPTVVKIDSISDLIVI
jgi:hypothetical protein